MEAFPKNPGGKYGRHAHCADCQRVFYKEWSQRPEVKAKRAAQAKARYAAAPEPRRESSRKWRAAHPDELRTVQRKNHLRYYYGITGGDYEALLVRQGGGCAICGGPPNGRSKARYHVDHDHGSKRVRGLLCHSCNVGIGALGDDPERLRRAIAYLTCADIAATTDVRTEQEGDAGGDAP